MAKGHHNRISPQQTSITNIQILKIRRRVEFLSSVMSRFKTTQRLVKVTSIS